MKWRQIGYDVATWERLPALQGVEFADKALKRLRSLRPIAAAAEELRQVRRRCLSIFLACIIFLNLHSGRA